MRRYNPTVLHKPVPFMNNGAVCWGNSLIQFLLSCPQFVEIINEGTGRNDIFIEFEKLIKKIRTGNPDSQYGPIAIISLLNNFSTRHFNINLQNGQQCPDEAFHFLIDAMKNDNIEYIFKTRYDSAPFCNLCKKFGDINRNEPNITIDLEFHKKLNNPVEFSENIKKHMLRSEKYVCDKCKQTNTISVIQYSLRMAQSVIIVRVKNNNVGGNFGLSKENVAYPPHFSLEGKDEILNYKLVAQIIHSGSQYITSGYNPVSQKPYFSAHSGGHYYAEVLRNDHSPSAQSQSNSHLNKYDIPSVVPTHGDIWYRCNDFSITQISSDISYPMNNSSYLLMYCLI